VASRTSEFLESRQLLTAPPLPQAAQQLLPDYNSFASEFLEDASGDTSALISNTITTPMAVLNSAFGEARDNILGMPMMSGVDSTMITQINSTTPGISSIFGSMTTLPDAVLPEAFDLGTETSSSDDGPSHWRYGTHGTLQYNTDDQTGSLLTFITRYVPASGDVTTDIFVASGELAVNQSGQQSFRLDASRIKNYVNGDSDNWVTQVTKDENGLNGFFMRSLHVGPVTIGTQINWSNSVIISKTANIDFVVPGHELHAQQIWSTSSEYRKMTYINTVIPDTTLLAEYEYSSQDGTNIAAGFGRRFTDRFHVSSVIARHTPISGPSQSKALIRAALESSTHPLALVFDTSITNGVPNPDNPWSLVPELDLLPKTAAAIRLGTLFDYEAIKLDVFARVVIPY